ncbi:MAG: hypothetical protein Q7R92_01910 [bacterium]|nr:hypothetical protein [bacterium]
MHLTAGYGTKKEGIIKTAPIIDDSFSLKTELAVAAFANSASDFTLAGKSLIFENGLGGIKKIIVRENRDQDDWPITKLAYWSESGSVTTETLVGWLVEAGWENGFFYILRQSGMHYTPTAVYLVKNGHLEKVKIVEKNGRVRDEFDAPVFLTEPYQKIVRERQYAISDVPRNVYIEELKDYKYFPTDNIFYEFRRVREETDMGNG